MKKVLWVSRHEMTKDQFQDLERVMGGPVELVLWKNTVKNVKDLAPVLACVDAAAVVLPTEKLAELMQYSQGKPVLQAVAERKLTGSVSILPDGRKEPEITFVHKGWQEILRLEYVTRFL